MDRVLGVDPQWYKKIWSLSIQDMSWVERTKEEVDFVVQALQLQGDERVLDLACGFGRHSLELARRGYSVLGVDITPAYVDEALKRAKNDHLDAQFICADLRDVSFRAEFDVVLNLADGAIGYLEDAQENLKIFDLIASSLKTGGKHLMGVCNGSYGRMHFPCRHWEIGAHAISLADFAWNADSSRMLYTAHTLKFGQPLERPREGAPTSTQLYTIDDLQAILHARGLQIQQTYGDYSTSVPSSDDQLTLLVYSVRTA
jgi:2-polyprenyl-3-methyl-5-hydroxy-6-metoxy-1,4-benzoquinol methylase